MFKNKGEKLQYNTWLCTIQDSQHKPSTASLYVISHGLFLSSQPSSSVGVEPYGAVVLCATTCREDFAEAFNGGRVKQDTHMIILYPVCSWFIVTAETPCRTMSSGVRTCCVGHLIGFRPLAKTVWESLQRHCWENAKSSLLNIQPPRY